jgi:protein CpxP
MKPTYKHLIAAAVMSAVGLAAVAQTNAAPDAAMGMGHRGHGPADAAQMQERMANMQARMAARLAEFKQKLQLSPGQEGAWNTYTEALKPASKPRMDHPEMSKLTTPERIDRMKAQRTARMAEMDKRAEATKAFYAVLTPEQKKTFDDESLRKGRHGRHGGGADGHHGHHQKS